MISQLKLYVLPESRQARSQVTGRCKRRLPECAMFSEMKKSDINSSPQQKHIQASILTAYQTNYIISHSFSLSNFPSAFHLGDEYVGANEHLSDQPGDRRF